MCLSGVESAQNASSRPLYAEKTILVQNAMRSSAQELAFADSNLKTAVREAVGKATGILTQANIQGLTKTHVTPLAGLTYLEWLCLYQNPVHKEVSEPLESLTG